MKKRALISVSDKTGLIEFGKFLESKNYELISTGGTFKHLKDAGLSPIQIDEVTNFPEMLDGRVKTLHPKVHGGILGRRGTDDAIMQQHGIEGIDMVVVNLYPFAATVDKPDCTLADAVENIDIGGPAMIRAAAKNFKFVTVVVNPKHYDEVAEMIAKDGCTTGKFRMQLAQEAFCHTSHYDDCIQEYLTAQLSK